MIRDRNEHARTTGLIAMSTATHILLFTGLGLIPSPSEVFARQEMEFDIIEPAKPEPPPPPPIPDVEPEPKRPESEQHEPAKAAEPEEPEPEPEPETPPLGTDEVADFTGETLTAEGGAGGWSTRVGSGAPLRGPVGKIGDPGGAAGRPPVPAGPRLVSVEDLAERPGPPEGMNGLLEANFPRRARMQGVEGSALMRVRILPDGRLGAISTIRESAEGWGFADACVKTLRQAGRWKRAVAKGGGAVATNINFTCRFEVD